MLSIPRNVKVWVPSLILVTYTHQISALGDNSTTRYGVNNIYQRDARTHVRTNVRTSSQLGVSAPLEQLVVIVLVAPQYERRRAPKGVPVWTFTSHGQSCPVTASFLQCNISPPQCNASPVVYRQSSAMQRWPCLSRRQSSAMQRQSSAKHRPVLSNAPPVRCNTTQNHKRLKLKKSWGFWFSNLEISAKKGLIFWISLNMKLKLMASKTKKTSKNSANNT